MDVGTDRARLHDQLKGLQARWNGVTEDWDDPVRRTFEEGHWEELQMRVNAALRAMDQLAHTLRQMQTQCS